MGKLTVWELCICVCVGHLDELTAGNGVRSEIPSTTIVVPILQSCPVLLGRTCLTLVPAFGNYTHPHPIIHHQLSAFIDLLQHQGEEDQAGSRSKSQKGATGKAGLELYALTVGFPCGPPVMPL